MKKIINLLLCAFFFSPLAGQASSCDHGVLMITNHTSQALTFLKLSTSQIAPFQNIPGGSLLNFSVGQSLAPNSSIIATVMSEDGSRADASGLMALQLGDVNIRLDYSFSTNDTFGLSPCVADKNITQDSGVNRIVVTSSVSNNTRPPKIMVDIYKVYSEEG